MEDRAKREVGGDRAKWEGRKTELRGRWGGGGGNRAKREGRKTDLIRTAALAEREVMFWVAPCLKLLVFLPAPPNTCTEPFSP